MKNVNKRLLVTLAVTLALTGCAVPGSHISHKVNQSNWLGQEQQTDISDQVAIFSINKLMLLPPEQQPSSDKNNYALQEALKNYNYRVGPGDVLTITVWDHPELTIPAGSMRSAAEAGNWVHNDGTLFYPYVGVVKVQGLTVSEIRTLLTRELAKFIEKPQVDVTVAAFRSQRVYITGEVKEPGTLPITNLPLTLLDAVNSVGGITEFADWDQVILTRNNQEQRFSLRQLYQSGAISQNTLLKPNDVIHVNRGDANKVFVLGEVTQPQTLMIERSGMTLAEALSSTGGFREATANASGIFVIRRSQDNTKVADVFQLDARDATALLFADQFRLQPRDVVYVTASPVARWNRVISQIIPSVTGLYNIGRIQNDLSN